MSDNSPITTLIYRSKAIAACDLKLEVVLLSENTARFTFTVVIGNGDLTPARTDSNLNSKIARDQIANILKHLRTDKKLRQTYFSQVTTPNYYNIVNLEVASTQEFGFEDTLEELFRYFNFKKPYKPATELEHQSSAPSRKLYSGRPPALARTILSEAYYILDKQLFEAYRLGLGFRIADHLREATKEKIFCNDDLAKKITFFIMEMADLGDRNTYEYFFNQVSLRILAILNQPAVMESHFSELEREKQQQQMANPQKIADYAFRALDGSDLDRAKHTSEIMMIVGAACLAHHTNEAAAEEIADGIINLAGSKHRTEFRSNLVQYALYVLNGPNRSSELAL